jgi:hypothetical protein
LLNDVFELVFGGDVCSEQVGGFEEFHYKPAGVFLEVEVECLVFYDVAMREIFHQHEVVP